MKKNMFFLEKKGFKVIGKEPRVEGRDYCDTCNTDITIIKSHDCLDGSMVFGNFTKITRKQLKKLMKSI